MADFTRKTTNYRKIAVLVALLLALPVVSLVVLNKVGSADQPVTAAGYSESHSASRR